MPDPVYFRLLIVFLLLFFFLNLFLERGEGRAKERERNSDVGERSPLVAFHMPATGDLACVLTGSRTSDLWVCRPMLNPLSHISQGIFLVFCMSFEMFLKY